MAIWLRERWSGMISGWSDLRGRFFYRLIWLGLISACIPIILAGTLYYQIAVKEAYQKAEEESRVSLKFVQDRMESLLAGIELESYHLALDPAIVQYLSEPADDHEFLSNKQMLAALERKKNANDFIGEIVLYRHGDTMLNSVYYGQIPLANYPFMKDIDFALNTEAQWQYLPQAEHSGYLSLVRRLPLMSNSKNMDRLIFHIRVDLLKSQMNDSYFYFPGKSLLVMDATGRALFHSQGPNKPDTGGMGTANLQRIVEEHKPANVFLWQDEDGREKLYSYQKTPSGRIYISLIPKEELYKQLGWIRWMTVCTVLLFLLVAVLLTVFNSMRVYSPIQQLLNHGRDLSLGSVHHPSNEISYIKECLNYLNRETKSLSTYLRKMEPDLRERFFHKLLEKGYVDQDHLLKECSALAISVTGPYVVLAVEQENIHKEKRFLPDDNAIIGFAMTNVMTELLEEYPSLSGYTLNTNRRSGVAIVSSRDMSSLAGEAKEYAAAVCHALNRFLKFKVSIGMGSVCAHISDVELSYREARAALEYRLLDDTRPVLYIEELENAERKIPSFYPHQEVEAIVAALVNHDAGAAKSALRSFSQAARLSQSHLITYQSYYLLLASVIHVVESRGGSIFHVLENNLFDQLRERKTATEICDWFTEVCFPLLDRIIAENDPSQLVKGKSDIMHVCQYIRENVQSDISLTQCSEMLSMTPAYVSRLFKKIMGFTFVEYVVTCKIEEAKRMLLETDLTLHEIAAYIGYTERNLSRIFQRYIQLTPGQFRAKYR
ncbi:helix-turn-helix domain-containing protein [Paenibacillus sp. NPDC056579]|uniref:helix-turn-helix domain-containing protein n=1 Tax=Paenibacillus sp. NPDC056579 TaxID=3345871 RepID=UPI00367AA7F7